MSTSEGLAAPASGTDDIPDFATLAADPEIAPLLDFEPVVRQLQKTNGWNAGMQRMFIAWLAHYGSPGKAAEELGKARSGIDKVYRAAGADSFRAAWDGAVALAERRMVERLASARSGAGAMKAPSINDRRKSSPERGGRPAQLVEGPAEGQMLNEHGEWEEEGSLRRRAADALDRITGKLLQARRLYLHEISASPGKRAAFEILAGRPVDWDKARRLEPQPDEPWRQANMRQPDMLLTAENGWMGDMSSGGEDRKAELRKMIDEYRAEQGMPAVDWDSDISSPPEGEAG